MSMDKSLVDKMREIKAMQAAMHGKVIYKEKSNGIPSGGKWEVVTEFKGRSHKDGGIDLEVDGGYVRKISGVDNPDDIAKNGRVWRDIGAAAYGIGEGLLDTLTFGATDQLTDAGYYALQKAANKNTADQMREQNSLRGYGTLAGAITGDVITGGATTGSAIQQGAKGVGEGVSKGSPNSKFAQQVGTWLPLAGSIAGMAYGNAGYAKGSDMAKFANIAGKVATGFNVSKSFFNQQAGVATPSAAMKSDGMQIMPSSFSSALDSIPLPKIGGGMFGSATLSPSSKAATADSAVDGNVFYAQVPMREDTLAYLTKYNINA